MKFFFGACLFFFAVVLLAYVPGKLLLLLLKRALSPLEDVTLACVLGLMLSGLVYWLLAFAHQGRLYLAWPLTAGAGFVWRHSSKGKSLPRHSTKVARPHEASVDQPCERFGLALAAVVALGVLVLALLPVYYTNFTWRADGTMRAYPVADVIFHIAIANELTHTIPPQAPVFSGHPLAYHYGMDLVVAMFATATSLNTPDLALRFVPTLFVVLSMLTVFCFSRDWLRSGYFGALVVFLVFFGEDFSFVPGMLFGEKADWSVRYFNVPAVFSVFFINSILPGIGLLFAALFCLQRYLQYHSRAWLFLSALLFVALIEVKVFTAAQILCSLGVAAVVYLLAFRNADLFRVAALTAAIMAPLLLSVFLRNKAGAGITLTFDPWLYVIQMTEVLGIRNRFTNTLTLTGIALPIYLIGCLGLRVIGVPAILSALFRPTRSSGLRFILAFFVVIGVLLALTCRVVPTGFAHAYNNSAWFLAGSKYVSWIFAVEVLQTWYRHIIARGMSPSLTAAGITLGTVLLSAPATVQHFSFWRKPDHVFGSGKVLGNQLLNYDFEMQQAIDFLTKNAQTGDVTLAGDKLVAPVLALTKCRVPLSYFANAIVGRTDYLQRSAAQREFWKVWQSGKVQDELLREAKVRYIIVSKQTEGVPPMIPRAISKVFENSEFAVFKVDPQRLSETGYQTQ
jgi:hypothetical protein